MRALLAFALLAFASAGWAWAHVGSPDVFFEGAAGPYPVFVTVRPPQVIPGTAEIEVRVSAADVREVRITPLPMTGDGAKFAPAPDRAGRSKDDPKFYTGTLWLMTSGSWQVRVTVEGARGAGELSVPVPAVANRTERMDAVLGSILAALGLFLALGLIAIVAAAGREAQLAPGAEPDERALAKGRRYGRFTAVLVVAVLALGYLWWGAEAGGYERYVYKPLEMEAREEAGKLKLALRDPGWLPSRKLDDFLPDHGHLMHLYVIRVPEMDRVWHLHPEMVATGRFEHALPGMPAGRYALFADVVHENGFPETPRAELELKSAVAGKPLEGDDSAGPTGVRLEFERERLVVKRPVALRFRAPAPLEPYMGMAGHAAVVKKDLTVFAHLHPSGSVPMAALMLARAPHAMGAEGNEVRFPYGFPKAGAYRIFVQVKLGGRVETAYFDVDVEDSHAR